MATPQSSVCIFGVLLVFSLTLAGLVTCAPSSSRGHHVTKRHILQMCQLISNHTNRGCLDYYNYGCYCGLGNAASRHMDGTDYCCLVHDRCYGEVSCFWMYPQFVGYDFDCHDGQCRCTDPNFTCQYTTCQCDLEFSRCLGRSSYNDDFRNFDRRRCHRPNVSIYSRRRRSPISEKLWRELAQTQGGQS